MAVYRQIHTTFWQDPFVLDCLDYKEKYFYLYLMTNSKTTQCGIYEISEKVMQLETDLSGEEITELINKFVEHEKIKYNRNTKEIYIINWIKYNPINNTNIEKCVLKELGEIKDETFKTDLIRACIHLEYKIPLIKGVYKGLVRGLHDPTKQKEEEEEEEKEEEEEQEESGNNSSLKKNDKDFREIATLYQHVIGQPNALTSGWINTILNDYGFDWVKSAMLEAEKRGKRNKKYIEAILQNWKNEGGMKFKGDGFIGANRENDDEGLGQYADIGIKL